MAKWIKYLICACLFVNGTGALFGGWQLIAHPDGSSGFMPVSVLEHSPFRDFLIPGLVLFIFNGLSSLIILALILIRYKNAPLLIAVQGAILTGWIAIQILMIREFSFYHPVFGSMGIFLIIAGLFFHSPSKKALFL